MALNTEHAARAIQSVDLRARVVQALHLADVRRRRSETTTWSSRTPREMPSGS